MEKLKNKIFVGIAAFLLAVASWLAGHSSSVKLGGAPGGGQAATASTTEFLLQANVVNTLFATSTGCISRIVSTNNGSAIYFTVGDENNQSPNLNARGHFQATSTLTAYDSAIYGCGLWKVVPNANATVTVTQFTSFR